MTTRHALLLLGLGVAGMAAAEVDKVPLPLQLPKPFFVGTPVPVRLPHLEMARAGPRPLSWFPAEWSTWRAVRP
jgi:hypothetical protein